MYYKDLKESLIEWIVSMYEKGASATEISNALRQTACSAPTIHKYVKLAGVRVKSKGRPLKKPEQMGLRLKGDDDEPPGEV